MPDHERFIASILNDPASRSIPLIFADWLEENGHEGCGKWLRFATELSATTWPLASQIGFINNYANAMNRLSRRRGGPRLGHIGRLASWEAVRTAYGVCVMDVMNEPEIVRIQQFRLKLCEIAPCQNFTYSQILGDANSAASSILTDRQYMESAARFFDMIRLPKSIQTTPNATGPGSSGEPEPGPV